MLARTRRTATLSALLLVVALGWACEGGGDGTGGGDSGAGGAADAATTDAPGPPADVPGAPVDVPGAPKDVQEPPEDMGAPHVHDVGPATDASHPVHDAADGVAPDSAAPDSAAPDSAAPDSAEARDALDDAEAPDTATPDGTVDAGGGIVCLGTLYPDREGTIDPDDPGYSEPGYTEEQVREMFAAEKAQNSQIYRAYRAAHAWSDLLPCAFCSCGCAASPGHLSAIDCFKDMHAFW